MMSVKRRVQRLETLSTTGDAGTIALVFSDGACVDSEQMTLAEYEARFGDNEPTMIVTVGGLSADDI